MLQTMQIYIWKYIIFEMDNLSICGVSFIIDEISILQYTVFSFVTREDRGGYGKKEKNKTSKIKREQ